tara:strand:+ start:18485 stop:19732 length:1248 start_codon:yes stop_codon:yes gene_type:complete
MLRSAFSLTLIAVALSACGKQAPVAVIDGYSKQRVPYENTYVDPADRAFDMQSQAIVGFQQEERYYVHGGDKLDQISKHFGVRESAILARNNIANADSMPVGEYIVIPSPNWQAENMGSTVGSSYRLTDQYGAQKAGSSSVPNEGVSYDEVSSDLVTKPVRQVNLMRQHTLQPGENIFRVAMKYNVSQFDILAANQIRNPADLKAGMVLNIPQAGDVVTGRDDYRYLADQGVEVPVQQAVPTKPVAIQKMQVNDTSSNATTAPTGQVQAVAETNYYADLTRKYGNKSVSTKGMIWPADGKVLKTFGNKGGGVSHSGINIALSKDAPIYAADTGTVIYADNGLELYGNLVLIQHKSGYVTAYAHNSKNIVKRHDKVQKGQLIAFAGNTGNVKETQLHFEVRKNAQAMDPMKVLPRK